MIRLFRHDGLEIMLNAEMIREIRPGPPTVLLLAGGEEMQVKNTPRDIMIKVRAERKGREDEEREIAPPPAPKTPPPQEPGPPAP
ncbi:MAG TPA: flagellar FlbD family protein [Candidatus Aminicenantes bacterium]|nr:flagellar FlbD family protein [Candidatus Aminicenantes bacterium]